MDGQEFLRAHRPERRNVRWGHPLAHIVRILPKAVEDAVRALPPTGTVLDFGCAEQPYRALFEPAWTYLGADLPGNPLADLTLQPGEPLDLEDASVDAVLSSQVLEHVVDPAGYLAECHRVLRPGGSLVLSTHGMMALHRDPIDFWRWTSDGLRHAIGDAGLEIQRFSGVMGLGATGIQFFQDDTILSLPRRTRRLYAVAMQSFAGFVDRRIPASRKAENAMVFVVTATREPT